MPIYKVGGSPVGTYIGTATSTPSFGATWQCVTDLAVACIFSSGPGAGALASSACSSSKVTGWTKVGDYVDATDNYGYSIWIGTVNAIGADTISMTMNGALGWYCFADEMTIGGSDSWALVTSNSLRTTTTAANYPNLTSGTAALQAYWGILFTSSSMSLNATPPGFTQSMVPTVSTQLYIATNGGLAATTAYQPGITLPGAQNCFSAGMIFSTVFTGNSSSPAYAGSAVGLSGGKGTWTNPTNADGAPDSVLATWTAP